MEADFSGYATKAGLKCSDGRTIMPDAFKHQDTLTVPLVWQHGHKDPDNVLGHAILENRMDGVYCYGFFNDMPKAVTTRGLVEHKDITMMSIWANDLIERAGRVLHGAIREVSLVLSGANPGALIENVTIRHSDGEELMLEDEVIIYTGLSFEHAGTQPTKTSSSGSSSGSSSASGSSSGATSTDTSGGTGEKTVQDVYDSMTEEQKQVLHYMIGEAMSSQDVVKQDNLGEANGEETLQDVYDSMSDNQKELLHYMIGEAVSDATASNNSGEDTSGSLKKDGTENSTSESIKHDNTNEENINSKKGNEMKHNVFETEAKEDKTAILSHADVKGIMADAIRSGSLKDTIEDYALAHGITDVDVLFPDAVSLDTTPQFLSRRVEWVASLLGAVRKSPFSRIKTIQADLTFEDARAKGYVKGSLKKEEFFGVARRVTTPTTVYKKQALDRDDIVDITDFDIVVWLKSEMRLMLDEEIARAILMGDGRDVSHEDKISESNIRPIAKEHELFATTITVNINDASSSVQEIIDAVVANRRYYKGTGQPNMYTSETIISMFLLLRDTLGRRIYKDLSEVASELRVASIISVEVMEEDQDLVAVIVNPVDYILGATAGGQVSMFDDFDIDYNKQKYLIETRLSGALSRLKSAIVVRKSAGTDTLVTPPVPTYNDTTHMVSVVVMPGVTYRNADTQAPIAPGDIVVPPYTTLNIEAIAVPGYYFATSENTSWSFSREA